MARVLNVGLFSSPETPVVPGAFSAVEGMGGQGGAGGLCGGAAEAARLPCLSRNNCDNPTVELSGQQKKRAESVQGNVKAFVGFYGLENCGFLTLTFDPKHYPEGLTSKEALKRLHNLCRRVLPAQFGEWIRVVEFQRNGMPHFHLLIDCREDVRTGFDWAHYDKTVAWSKAGRKGPKPSGSLNRTPRLSELHSFLRDSLPAYGFGRSELVPVRKAEAVGFYMGGYMAKSLANRPQSAKGSRFVGYSRGFLRTFKGGFSWAGNHTMGRAGWLWRAKLGTWAYQYGIKDMDGVRRTFGPRWAYRYKEEIIKTGLTFWPDYRTLEQDPTGCTLGVPEGAEKIHLRRYVTEGVEFPRLDLEARGEASPPPLPPVRPGGREFKLRPAGSSLCRLRSRESPGVRIPPTPQELKKQQLSQKADSRSQPASSGRGQAENGISAEGQGGHLSLSAKQHEHSGPRSYAGFLLEGVSPSPLPDEAAATQDDLFPLERKLTRGGNPVACRAAKAARQGTGLVCNTYLHKAPNEEEECSVGAARAEQP